MTRKEAEQFATDVRMICPDNWQVDALASGDSDGFRIRITEVLHGSAPITTNTDCGHVTPEVLVESHRNHWMRR
jgi:hypothetical protein